MHRIDTATATPDNRFTEGDPTIPVAATVVSADWLNAVQEELAAVITGAGLELDKADNAQLRQAISQAITAAKPGLATTTAPGLVQIGGGLAVTPRGLLSVLLASVSQAGIMRPDGTTCTVNGGVLSVLKQTSEYMEEWRKSWIGVPRPWRGTTLPPNHCWSNGDAVLFADWPELKAVYDAGGFAGVLMAWDASREVQAANLGKWRPNALNPTGLYTPNLTGQFLRCWGPGASEGAGVWHRDEIRNILGAVYDHHFGVGPSATGALSYAQAGLLGNSPSGSIEKHGAVTLDASKSVPTGVQNVPQHVWQPSVIYLGKAAAQ